MLLCLAKQYKCTATIAIEPVMHAYTCLHVLVLGYTRMCLSVCLVVGLVSILLLHNFPYVSRLAREAGEPGLDGEATLRSLEDR